MDAGKSTGKKGTLADVLGKFGNKPNAKTQSKSIGGRTGKKSLMNAQGGRT